MCVHGYMVCVCTGVLCVCVCACVYLEVALQLLADDLVVEDAARHRQAGPLGLFHHALGSGVTPQEGSPHTLQANARHV